MTSKIKILPDHIINKIAAGEVVERPASVVKELIENSIDAEATGLLIDIEEAGRRLIRIIDNGSGMSMEDARTAFMRHATSKIADDADLDSIRTMGFRGEALSSIAAVSHVRMLSALKGARSGVLIEIEGGVVKAVSEAAAPQGTTLEIGHLFYNTPARRKFLKSPATEFSHILTTISRQAMAHPDVLFRLTHNKKKVLELLPSSSIKERISQLSGGEVVEHLIEFAGGRDSVHVHGLIGRPGFTRADKTYQDFFVNRRAVRNPSLTHALYSAYSDMLMRDRHPVAFIFIEIDPALVDVNVHPAKAEIRFRNQSQLHDLVRDVIREGLRAQAMPERRTTHAGNVFAEHEHADRVREAVANFGTRNMEYPFTPGLFPQAKREYDRAPALGDESMVKGGMLYSLSSFVSNPDQELHPLAQIHDSFIIAQSREGMSLIDQHAAHERVLFEKLQDQFRDGRVPIQALLVPDQVELGPAQSLMLAAYLPEISKLGLLVEDFGNNTFVIKAVPALLAGADYKQLLLDILDEVNVHGKSGKMEQIRDEMLSVMACHPAIKIHRRLDRQEMEQLLTDLFKCRMPFTCPHGRPTVVRFSMDELLRMFKRK
jgi:DNA mismatch repair protein MutL